MTIVPQRVRPHACSAACEGTCIYISDLIPQPRDQPVLRGSDVMYSGTSRAKRATMRRKRRNASVRAETQDGEKVAASSTPTISLRPTRMLRVLPIYQATPNARGCLWRAVSSDLFNHGTSSTDWRARSIDDNIATGRERSERQDRRVVGFRRCKWAASQLPPCLVPAGVPLPGVHQSRPR